MPGAVHILLIGDNSLEDWDTTAQGRVYRFSQENSDIRAVYLAHGMQSGDPAFYLAARKNHDEYVVVELSLKMLLTIAKTMRAKAEMDNIQDLP